MISMSYNIICFQNNRKIVANDFHNGNTYTICSVDETIYVDNRIHLKFDEANNNVMLSMVICDMIYSTIKILVANVACIRKIVVGSNCNFEFFFYRSLVYYGSSLET
jgi:hypothetical protein